MPRRKSDARVMKEFRQRFELTQKQVGAFLLTDQSNISQIELGKHGMMPFVRMVLEAMDAHGRAIVEVPLDN